MKYLKLSLLAIIGIVLSFSSCSKYEDGPWLSLRTKKARLAGTWKLDSYEVNGESYSASTILEEPKIKFDKDGSGKFISPVIMGQEFSASFDWEFVSKKEKIKITKQLGGLPVSEEYKILRLTNKELNVEMLDVEEGEIKVKTIKKYKKE